MKCHMLVLTLLLSVVFSISAMHGGDVDVPV